MSPVFTLVKPDPRLGDCKRPAAYLRNALQLAANYVHGLHFMSDEVAAREGTHTITDMRDLIVAALEKME